MPAVRIIGILCLVLAAGCAGVQEKQANVLSQSGPLSVDPSLTGPDQDRAVAAEPRRPEAIQNSAALAPRPAEPRLPIINADAASGKQTVPAAAAPPSASRSAAKAAPPHVKAPAAVSVSATAIEQPRKMEAPLPVAKKLEPPLDVATLKARLRDTNAIGVFTKIALKNQVDDLLQQFRAHYLSGQNTSVAALRQPYDMLVLKVLALVQDGDPSLARTIAGSREAIWGILADPAKFDSAS